MKKNLILLTTLISTLALTSCGRSSDSSATSTPASETSEIQQIIENMRKGFTFTAAIDETAAYYTSDPATGGTLTGESDSRKVEIVTTFENSSDATGYEYVFSSIGTDGTKTESNSEVFVLGSDGKVKVNTLTTANKVVESPVYDANDSDNLNYSVYFDNPFNHIMESDFTLISGNSYRLSTNKASYISSQYLSTADDIFYGVLDETTVTIENGAITSMVITPTAQDISESDGYSATTTYYNLSAKASLTFSNVGTARVSKPTPYTTQAYHENLQAAFNRFEIADNFTYSLLLRPVDGGVARTTNLFKFYYTNGAILFRTIQGTAGATPSEPERPDPYNDVLLRYDVNGNITPYGYDAGSQTWTTAAASSFSALIGQTLDNVRLNINEIAAEVFTQDSETTTNYNAVPEVLDSIGYGLVPNIIGGSSPAITLAYATKFTATLNSTTLTGFEVETSYNDSYTARTDTFSATLTNYGSTTFPGYMNIR